jgi:hypothetical protein
VGQQSTADRNLGAAICNGSWLFCVMYVNVVVYVLFRPVFSRLWHSGVRRDRGEASAISSVSISPCNANERKTRSAAAASAQSSRQLPGALRDHPRRHSVRYPTASGLRCYGGPGRQASPLAARSSRGHENASCAVAFARTVEDYRSVISRN